MSCRLLILVCLFGALLLFAACGSETDSAVSATESPTATSDAVLAPVDTMPSEVKPNVSVAPEVETQRKQADDEVYSLDEEMDFVDADIAEDVPAASNETDNTAAQEPAPTDTLSLISFFKTKPRVGDINDLLLSDAQVAAMLQGVSTDGSSASIPMEILMQMLFVDKMMQYDIGGAFEKIFQLTNLRGLDLRAYNLDSIPSGIGNLQNLEVLILNDNNLTNLPQEIFDLPKLKHLAVAGNKLTQIPAAIDKLKQLVYLDYSYNDIKTLPNELGSLSKLETLYLSKNNNFTDVASIKVLCGLSGLKILNISYLNLPYLPECIGQLGNLTSLSIGANHLRGLPKSIAQLKQLQSIALADLPQLDYVETFTLLANCPSLQGLYLFKYPSTTIPAEIGQLSHLRTLNLFDGNYTQLPPEICNLKELEFLNLSNSALQHLPGCIANLHNLEVLGISLTDVTDIPEGVYGMKHLRKINTKKSSLSYTQVERIQQLMPWCQVAH